ncbi:MAG: hypothetical protein WA733_22620 [Methylocystis sp.]
MATKTPETSVFRKLSKPAAQSFITGFPVVVVLARERCRAVAASATLDTSLPIAVRFFREFNRIIFPKSQSSIYLDFWLQSLQQASRREAMTQIVKSDCGNVKLTMFSIADTFRG